jgi:hypothetical protein
VTLGLLATVALCTTLAVSRAGYAEDSEASIKIGGLLDTRFAATDDTTSWLDYGLGKTRYGGVRGDSALLARLAAASVYVTADLNAALSVRVHLGIDAEPGASGERGRVDLVEAFAAYRPDLSTRVGLRTRVGFFFPPISLEHRGPAWATYYTITPSAANSWVGEELRTAGAEAGFAFRLGERNTLSLFGAGFGANDPAGSLLAWRGWALGDRVTRISDQVPLAPIPSILPGGAFSRQAEWVGPFQEIDGRIGYYAGGSWTSGGRLELDGLYYNNRGDPTAFDGWQWAWETSFVNAGLRLTLPHRFEILGQYMEGETYVGRTKRVEAHYRTAYGLASWAFRRHRLSARYDRFDVKDRDNLGALDDNNEDGEAWTGAYIFETARGHRLALELLRVESDRPARATIGLPTRADETLLQASLRIVF